VPTQQELKDAIQLALDDNNMEAASELRAMYLAAEESSVTTEEQPAEPVEETPELKPISWFDEFEFAFDSSHSDVNNWGLALEAKLALGDWGEDENGDLTLKNGYELYGEEFMDEMDYDQRRDFLLNRRAEGIKEEHLNTILVQEKEGKSASAEILGSFVGMLMSPTTLLPVGKGVTGAAKAGGLLGLEIEAAEQTAEGELDVVDLAKSTAVGAVGSAAVTKVAQATKNAVKVVNAKRQAKRTQAGIDNMSAKVEDQLATGLAEGLTPKQSWTRARQNLGLSASQVADLAAHGKVMMPSVENATKIVAAKNNPIVSSNAASKMFDALAAPLSTVVRNISEPVFGRLRKFEYDVSANTQSNMEAASDFMIKASKLRKKGDKKAEYNDFETALFNGNFQKATNLAKVYFPEILEPLQKVIGKEGVLNTLHKDLKESGVDVGFLENYFPRVVKDVGKLLNALGATQRSSLEKVLRAEATKQKVGSWQELDEAVVTDIINKHLRGGQRSGAKIGLAQQRVIEEIDPLLKDHYYSAPESLNFYINSAVREVERRKFFGKNVVLDEANKVNLEQSIGAFAQDALRKGEISSDQLDDLSMLLQARFVLGEKSGHAVWVGAKDAQTMALLAQFDSAVIQLADIGASVYANGLRNTIKSIVPAIRKKTETSAEEFGVLNTISADINSKGVLANGLDTVLKYSGFKGIDRLGKDTFISAAYKNNTQLARTSPEKISEKWGQVFGDETANLIEDLKAGRMSDNVKLLLFNQLSDVQPISLSEMPLQYLKSPNGRILYALKSFAIKQLDIMRRDFAGQLARGNYKEGFTNMGNYAMSIGLAGGAVGTARDILQTKELRPEQFDDKVFETWMSLLFLNKYTRDRYLAEGEVGQAVLGVVTPAIFNIADQGGKALQDILFEADNDPEKFNAALKNIPVIGKLGYYWLLGGAEKKLEQERKQEERDRRNRLGING
jgi:hypothetical protein